LGGAGGSAWGSGGGGFGPFEVGVTSLMVLNFMWLKFAVIWRFFRLWALVSGVEVPENMLRCVNNNATILGFWKGWHASYNRWLVGLHSLPGVSFATWTISTGCHQLNRVLTAKERGEKCQP
jgi:hypothetical protein